MNFSDKLDRAIGRATDGNVPNPINDKLLAEFNRAADKAVVYLSDIQKVLDESGIKDNKAAAPFVDQLNMLVISLKEDSDLRKNFKSILSVSIAK